MYFKNLTSSLPAWLDIFVYSSTSPVFAFSLAFVPLGRVSVKVASRKSSKITGKLDRRNQVHIYSIKLVH